jgi:hypothetical protein
MTRTRPRTFDAAPVSPKLRAKIDTTEQINLELKKIYRLQRNKQITLAEAKSLRESLIALRNGLPAPIETPKPVLSTLTITTVEEGCQFVCGVLMPFQMAREAMAANHAGEEAWRAHLVEIEPLLTKTAFDRLRRAPALERVASREPTLRLVPPSAPTSVLDEPAQEDEPSPDEAQLLSAVLELLAVARAHGHNDELDALERRLRALRRD